MRYIVLCIVLIPFCVKAQSKLSTKSKKAAEYYYQADNFWVRGQYAPAADLFQKAIDKDNEFFEAYFRLGVIHKAKGQTKLAEEYLTKTLELSATHAGALFELGELSIQQGNYEKVKTYITAYLDLNPRNKQRKDEANKLLESANYALENIKRATEINPKPLPAHINQFAMQYFPVITADQEYLIYTRRLGTTMNHDEDIVIARKDSVRGWSAPESISANINSLFNEGTCTISADGRTLIFTSCHGRNGYGSCDLYISNKIGEEWTVAENLGPTVNSSSWDSQPSLSADGRTLYFVSNRSQGIGSRDIWKSQLDESDIWSKPVNLGAMINTAGDEVSPFIHPNNKTLYFATNGRKGFGGFDVFYSEKVINQWQEPVNMGYPINTGEDQVSLFISPDGKTGYYSHENLKNPNVKGEIYEFTVPQGVRVNSRASFVKGTVFDKKTKEPLSAKIELYDLEQNERIAMVRSDSLNGEYLMVLTEGSSYAFYVNKEGYLFKSLSFTFDQNQNFDSKKIDIPLDPISSGASTVLKNIFFEFDKFALQEKSKTELQKIISFLETNPGVKIEIQGYTDNVGVVSYNQQLSVNRAKAVYQHLIKEGVPQSTLTYRGYGQNHPIATNETDEGRQLNRRIEFIIKE